MHRPDVSFWDMLDGEKNIDFYHWGMAPRRNNDVLDADHPPGSENYLKTSEDAQLREYYYLVGNLIKWFTLYGPEGVPRQDSWVWNHFPAGHRWKELVNQYGLNAIEAMVERSHTKPHSPFLSGKIEPVEFNEGMLSEFQAEKKEAESKSKNAALVDVVEKPDPVVVFYQITLPPHRKNEAMSAVYAQFEVLSMGRYDNETHTFDQKQKVLLYFSIAGGKSLLLFMPCFDIGMNISSIAHHEL